MTTFEDPRTFVTESLAQLESFENDVQPAIDRNGYLAGTVIEGKLSGVLAGFNAKIDGAQDQLRTAFPGLDSVNTTIDQAQGDITAGAKGLQELVHSLPPEVADRLVPILTRDLTITARRYLHAMEDGDVSKLPALMQKLATDLQVKVGLYQKEAVRIGLIVEQEKELYGRD